MSQDVIVKEVPKQWIASVRETIADYPAVGALFPRVFNALGPGMSQM